MFAAKLFKRGSKKAEEKESPEEEEEEDAGTAPDEEEEEEETNQANQSNEPPTKRETTSAAMSDEEAVMEGKLLDNVGPVGAEEAAGRPDSRDGRLSSGAEDTEEAANVPLTLDQPSDTEDMPADDGPPPDEDDEDEDVQSARIEGSYDPADYEHLTVSPEISQMFQFITSYTPQTIELEHRLKPFIPDFIPAIGDIDAFIKVERPDGKADSIGLSVLDEPRAQQSDKNVLDLQLRAVAKTTTHKQTTVASVPNADRNHKAVEKWIKDIGDLHRSKPAPSVHYNKPMPDIDFLMQEWPAEFEEVLSSTHLPTADLDCDLATYVEIICSIMDIPVYKSKVQSLHVLFTLYSAFKQSGHFGQQPEANPNYQQMTL